MTTMATPPTDDTKQLFKLLVDRDWHHYDGVVTAIAATVPPGRALRKYEKDLEARRNNKRNRDKTDYDSKLQESDRILYGARSCAQTCIAGWRRQGVIIFRGEGKGREIQVRRGFTSPNIAGFETAPDDDPGLSEQGYTEVPPGDSDGSGDGLTEADEPSRREPAPEAGDPEPAVEEPTGAVVEVVGGRSAFLQALREQTGSALGVMNVTTTEEPEPAVLSGVGGQRVVEGQRDVVEDQRVVEDGALLGLATTRELLEELKARGEVEASVGYYAQEAGDMALGAQRLLEELPGSLLGYRTTEPQTPWKTTAAVGPEPELTPIAGHTELPPEPGTPLPAGWQMCPDCGLLILDQQVHDQWHREHQKALTSSDVALLNESQLRDLLRVELDEVLDRFQAGMQSFLISQFSQLEALFLAAPLRRGRWAEADGPAYKNPSI